MRVSGMEQAPCVGCATCTLRNEGHVPELDARDLDSPILFVGEAPGEDETIKRKAFVGPAGRVFDRALAEAGIVAELAKARVNAVACRPPGNRAPSPQEIVNCRELLERQITRSTAQVVVPLGGTAMHSVAGTMTYRKSSKVVRGRNKAHDYAGIGKQRGYVVEFGDLPEKFVVGYERKVVGVLKSGPRKGQLKEGRVAVEALRIAALEGKVVVPALHPSGVMIEGFKEAPALVADLAKARRIAQGAGYEGEMTRLIVDVAEAEEAWDDYAHKVSTEIEFDLETRGLEPGMGSIERISFCWEDGVGVSLVWGPRVARLTAMILGTDETKVGHNILGFDLLHLAANEVRVEDPIEDTLVMAAMLQPDMPKDLNYLGSLYLITKRWKHTSKSDPVTYSALDSVRLRPIAKEMRRQLRDEGMWRHYQEDVVPSMRTLVESTVRGIRVDEQRLIEWRGRLLRQRERLARLWEVRQPTVSLASPQQVLRVLRCVTRELVRDTAKETLQRLMRPSKAHPRGLVEARLVRAWRKRDQDLSKYAAEKLFRRAKNGALRAHPVYSPNEDDDGAERKILTASGRTAAKEPPIQDQPQHARAIYRADEGYALYELDWEQIEAWLVAIESRDRRMLDILYSGQKIHAWVWEELKKVDGTITYGLAKRGVHGTDYGMGWMKLQKTLEEEGVYVAASWAKDFIGWMHEQFPQRARWQQEVVDEARKLGYLANAFGRRRRFHCDARGDVVEAPAAIAFRPSSNMASMMRRVLRDAPDVLGMYDGEVLWDGHDSVGIQVPVEEAQEAVGAMVRSMERTWPEITGEEWKWWCPVSVKTGENWRDLVEVEREEVEDAVAVEA